MSKDNFADCKKLINVKKQIIKYVKIDLEGSNLKEIEFL